MFIVNDSSEILSPQRGLASKK